MFYDELIKNFAFVITLNFNVRSSPTSVREQAVFATYILKCVTSYIVTNTYE